MHQLCREDCLKTDKALENGQRQGMRAETNAISMHMT